MPGMNGPLLFGYAKQRWPELKVIMVSGEATIGTLGRLKDLGADLFLEKPFRIQKLLAMVKSETKTPVTAPVEPKKADPYCCGRARLGKVTGATG
jgi:DNA-binding NtrC family response regulator